MKQTYDCFKCPGYCCCAYAAVAVKDSDMDRLAKHFGISKKDAYLYYTLYDARTKTHILQSIPDKLFDNACVFLDQVKRACTIYNARPAVCRMYPGAANCAFYDFLEDERVRQKDDNIDLVVKFVAR